MSAGFGKAVGNLALHLSAGVLLGVLTLFGQQYLPDFLSGSLANSGAVWLIPGYLLAYCRAQKLWQAVTGCILSLFGAVLGYYGLQMAVSQSVYWNRMMLVWLACALVGGTIFGIGAWLAQTKENWWKFFGKNLLPAVFLAEGVQKLLHFSSYAHMLPSIAVILCVGFGLYFLLHGKECFGVRNLISAAGLILLGVAGYEGLYWISS